MLAVQQPVGGGGRAHLTSVTVLGLYMVLPHSYARGLRSAGLSNVGLLCGPCTKRLAGSGPQPCTRTSGHITHGLWSLGMHPLDEHRARAHMNTDIPPPPFLSRRCLHREFIWSGTRTQTVQTAQQRDHASTGKPRNGLANLCTNSGIVLSAPIPESTSSGRKNLTHTRLNAVIAGVLLHLWHLACICRGSHQTGPASNRSQKGLR